LDCLPDRLISEVNADATAELDAAWGETENASVLFPEDVPKQEEFCGCGEDVVGCDAILVTRFEAAPTLGPEDGADMLLAGLAVTLTPVIILALKAATNGCWFAANAAWPQRPPHRCRRIPGPLVGSSEPLGSGIRRGANRCP